MNGIERIQAAASFEATDRVPLVPVILGYAATLAGVPLERYLRDGEVLARCQVQAQRRYGYDVVFAFMDLSVETEAMGSTLKYHERQYPDIVSYALTPEGVADRLVMPDPHRSGRMPELLRAAGILRREVGDQALVVGAVTGPLTLATQLLGMEAALYFAADDPAGFERLLDHTTEAITRFGCAQIAAGAHVPMVFEPSASPVIVPPRFFSEFLLPRLQRVLAAFKAAGGMLNWVMITGPIEPILPYCAELGTDILHLDYCVDPVRAQEVLPRVCLAGNLKPLAFVTAAPEEIAAEARRLCSLFADRGGFLLSSGCEIPPESSAANVEALIAAVHPRV